jgi:hypothetical protein
MAHSYYEALHLGVEEDGKSKLHRSLQPKEESRKSAHEPIAGEISLGPQRSPSTLRSAGYARRAREGDHPISGTACRCIAEFDGPGCDQR